MKHQSAYSIQGKGDRFSSHDVLSGTGTTMVSPERNKKTPQRPIKMRGFTSIEFVTAISIIFLLLVLLMPAVRHARDAARAVNCKNNLKQIALALHNYHDAQETFPPGYISIMGVEGVSLDNEWGWGAFLLPYLDQTPLFQQIDFEVSVNSTLDYPSHPELASMVIKTPNSVHVVTELPAYMCPHDSISYHSPEFESVVQTRSYFPSSYSAISGIEWMDLPCATVTSTLKLEDEKLTESPCRPADGAFFLNSRVRLKDIHDGFSQTMFLGEAGLMNPRNTNFSIPFLKRKDSPQNWRLNWAGVETPVSQEQVLTAAIEGVNQKSGGSAGKGLQSSHVGGVHVAFVDGSVQFLSENIDSRTETPFGVLQRMATIRADDLLRDF